VQSDDVHSGAAPTKAGDGCERQRQAEPGQLGHRVPQAHLAVQFGQGLGQKDQTLAGQPQPSQQRLVEHEHPRQVRVRRQRGMSWVPSDSAVSHTTSGSPVSSGPPGPLPVLPPVTPGGPSTFGPTLLSGQCWIGHALFNPQVWHSPGARFSTCQREKPYGFAEPAPVVHCQPSRLAARDPSSRFR